MSLAENYRSSFDYREILRILQKSTTLQDNLLWQSHGLGKTIIPVQHLEIDFVNREVVVTYDNRRFYLERELPLYVKLDHRTSVFKVTDYRLGTSTVEFPFPKELKTQELRAFPRHQFSLDNEQIVWLKPSLAGVRDSGNELQARVIDVSQYGLGLLVSDQNRFFLKNNRILWVTRLGETKLEYPVLAEVVYLNAEIENRSSKRRQKELKVGIKLSGLIPDNVFQSFIQ